MIQRIRSIDIVRGVVMVLMAIDHVRVYSGLPAGGPTPGIFFTRWVTHFCAPAFAFFAGTSAFLYARKLASSGELARHLFVRGIILVILELTLIRFCWTFNFAYDKFVLAGVIWMLGWCMILLAPLVLLPARVVGAIGLAIIFFQQLFSYVPRVLPQSIAWLWEFIYTAGLKVPFQNVGILYVIVPWIGVMAAGYGFGTIMVLEPARRDRICFWLGVTATLAFLIVGSIGVIQHPVNVPPGRPTPPKLFQLLNQQKYPASQLFLLMTLGPIIALLPLAERMRGWFSEAIATYGRVPMFYYLLHIPAIHIAALAVNFLREGAVHQQWYAFAPYASVPPDHRWSLGLLYLIFFLVVAALYAPCRWFAGLKGRYKTSWIRYI